MDTSSIEKYITWLTDWAVVFVPNLFIAAAILFVGFWLVKKIAKIIEKALEKAKVAPEIAGFLSSILNIAMKIAIILVAGSSAPSTKS